MKPKNDYWLYHLEYTEENKDLIQKAVRGAIENSGGGKQRISAPWLLYCLNEKDGKGLVTNLNKILQQTLENQEYVQYDNIVKGLLMTGLTKVWERVNLKHILEYDNNFPNEDGTKGRVKLIGNHIMVQQVLDDLGT